MAGNVSKVYIEVEVDGKGGIKVLRQIGTESTKTGKTGSKAFKDMDRSAQTLNTHMGMIKKLAGTLFAGWGIKRIYGEMKDMVEKSETQRKAIAGMEAAMRSMGRYTPEMSDELQDLAASLQQVTNYGDEATLQGVKFLMTYRQITDDLMPDSIKTMQDLAALMGGDVVQAANMLGKASMGMTGELRRVGITVDSATYKAQGYLGVLKEIQSQVSGQAAAMRDPWTQLSNVIGDTKESLGGLISIAFRPYAEDMISLLPHLSKSWRELAASIKETQRVELEYEIRKIKEQLATGETTISMPSTMAPDITVKGLTEEEKAALKAKLERYQKTIQDMAKSTESKISKALPGPADASKYWSTEEGKIAMSKALATVSENAHEEWRLRSKYSEATAADIAKTEKAMADFRKAQAERSEKAYADMYDYLQFKSDGYYQYRTKQIGQETDALAEATGNRVLAHQVYIERIKELDKQREDAAKSTDQAMIELSQRTAEAMEQNFSDLYFDIIMGEYKDLGDYATAIYRSIARAEADYLGQKTREALFGTKESSGLISIGADWFSSLFSGGSKYPGAGTYGVTPGSVNWHARGGSFGPDEWIGVGEKGPEIIYTGKKSGQVIPTGGVGDVSIQVNVINNGEPMEQSAPPQVRFDGAGYIADVHIGRMINNRTYRQSNKQALR